MPARPTSDPTPRARWALRLLLDSRTCAHIWRAPVTLTITRIAPTEQLLVATVVIGNRLCRQIGIDFAVRRSAALVRRLLGLNGATSDAREVGVVKVGSG